MLGDDGAETASELLQTLAVGDGFLDRGGEVGQKIGFGRSCDHEGAVVRLAPDVAPSSGGHQPAELAAEESDLLREGAPEDGSETGILDAFRHVLQRRLSSMASKRPASSAAAKAIVTISASLSLGRSP